MAAQSRHGHRKRKALGRIGEIAHNAEGLGCVAQRERLGQLESRIVAAHAHILLHVLDADAAAVFGQDLAQLLDRQGQFLQVGAGRLGKERSRVRCNAEPLLGHEAIDPAGDAIVRDGIRLEDHAGFLGILVERGAFVDVLAALGGIVVGLVADHQHGRRLDTLEVHADVLHFLHHLRLLDHHQLASDHHGELPGGAHHLVGRHVGAEIHELSEIALLRRNHRFHQQLAESVDVVVFLAEEQIERLDVAAKDFLAQRLVFLDGIGRGFRHIVTKVRNKASFRA